MPDTTFARTPQVRGHVVVSPDPPYDPDGRMTSFDHLSMPATGRPLAGMESERLRAEAERQAREAAEARVRELEERLRGHGA